jgi:hypothetical protein
MSAGIGIDTDKIRLGEIPLTLSADGLSLKSPEKKGNGFGSPNCSRRTTATWRYFFVRTLSCLQ